MKKINNQYSFITIGGSHISENYVGEEFSFVNLFTKQTGYQCLAKLSDSFLKDSATEIQKQITQNNPEIIILQPDDKRLLSRNLNRFMVFCLFIFYPVILMILKINANKYLKNLKLIIANNPNKYFIVLSPIPSSNIYQNKIKKLKGEIIRKLLLKSTNLTYIDFLNSIKTKKKHFIESSHLNRFGHILLARIIAKKSSLDYFTTSRSFAT